MNKLWVTKKQFLQIQNLFKDCPYKILFFGSRTTGKQNKFSDLDICLKDKEQIPNAYISSLKNNFSESSFPFLVDIIDYYSLSSSFKEIIDNNAINFKECEPVL